MGCDYSSYVKEMFNEQVSDLQDIKIKIEKRQARVQHMADEFYDMQSIDIDIPSIKENLKSQLSRLEQMITDIEFIKDNSLEDSLNVSNSIDDILLSPKNFPMNSKSKESSLNKPKDPDSKYKSLKSSVKMNTVESILEDPEILALINKNRDKFLKKITK
jgi:hypothetical protein